MTSSQAMKMETPPRTWRKPPCLLRLSFFAGNTSTHVEKTPEPFLKLRSQKRNTSTHVEKTRVSAMNPTLCRKHLHARGENVGCYSWGYVLGETPPRTWRKLPVWRPLTKKSRNTSTHVEKTDTDLANLTYPEKHLHARGENSCRFF